MPKIADWDERIGRRLRLRDLRVLFEVMQSGTLAKAALQLRVSQPAVSQVIADLEHALGVKLFDRSSRGVEPTLYARALLTRGRAAFDELRQGIRDIEFLANPSAGELTIAYPESLSLTVLPQIIERFSEKHPGVVIRGDIVAAPSFRFPGLRDRTHDLILSPSPPDDYPVDGLHVEVLFDDQPADGGPDFELGPLAVVACVGMPPAHVVGLTIDGRHLCLGEMPRTECTFGFGLRDPCFYPFPNNLPLEFGKDGQYPSHRSTRWRRQI